jgi:hypothetical protein
LNGLEAMRLLSILSLILLWTPVQAADLDDPVAAARADIEAICTTVEYSPGWLHYVDLTDDGLDDLIITYWVRCDGASSIFCGTAGCSGGVYVRLPDGRWHDTGLSPNVSRTEWQGQVAITFWMHGVSCGRTGVEPCISTRVWNGTEFEIVDKNY